MFICIFLQNIWRRGLRIIIGETMFNKKILIALTILAVIFVGSLCVAVADSSSGQGTFKDLASEISGDNKTGVITLTKNYVNTDNYDADGVKVTGKNLVIRGEKGKEITIDANNVGRIIDANNTQNVTFENINFVNGNSTKGGGAVVLGDEKSNSAVNCNFEHCYSNEFGGALDGNAFNCNFKDCSANYHGGAIFDGSATNCTFENCFSLSCGGAISYHNATNCKFTDCYSYWRGGALYEANAIGCEFKNCYSSEGGSMYHGNAFNCKFENSAAKNGNGGAILDGTAEGCTFNSCSVMNGTGNAMYGGTAKNCQLDKADASNVTMK